jgi:hypothetical protein
VDESDEVIFDPTKAESQTLTTIGAVSAPKAGGVPMRRTVHGLVASEEVMSTGRRQTT